eukprot:Rhum_TRINITY_DN11408_c0_g2::Rhum_TRINITY_DN11408_c0_g2_i1::g.44527::m.44527
MPGFIEGEVAVWSRDGTEANTVIGIVLNKFKGFVRLRLLERMQGANDDDSDSHAYVMALPVDCFPVHECSKAGVHVSEEDMGEEPDIERTDAVIQIPSEAMQVAFFIARNRTTSTRVPAPGTLERVFQASSPTPATRCPAPFVLKESELCALGLEQGTLGVFATVDLPKGYYAGELLGETGWNVETFEDAGHRNVWPVSRKPTHSIDTGLRLRHLKKSEKIADYIDSQDPETSSFLRYVNAALPGVLVSKAGATGFGNCEFVQMQERVYLRTTAKVAAGKELLAPAPNNPTPVGVMPVPNRQTEQGGKAKAKAKAAVLCDSDSEDDEDIERKSRRSSTSSQQSAGSGSGAPQPPRAKRAKVEAKVEARTAKAAATRQRKKEEAEAEKAEKARKKKAAKAEKAAAAAAAKKAIDNKKAAAAAAVAAKPLPPPPPSATPQVRKTRAPPRVCDALSSTRVRDVELPVPTAVDRGANDQYVHKSHFNEMKRRAKEAENVANHHLVKASQWEAAYNRQVAKTDIAESRLRLIESAFSSQKEAK